jgi:hypothetical protein
MTEHRGVWQTRRRWPLLGLLLVLLMLGHDASALPSQKIRYVRRASADNAP